MELFAFIFNPIDHSYGYACVLVRNACDLPSIGARIRIFICDGKMGGLGRLHDDSMVSSRKTVKKIYWGHIG